MKKILFLLLSILSIDCSLAQDTDSLAIANPKPVKDLLFTVNGIQFTMKYVEGGTYTMGATSQMLPCDADEAAHEVTVQSFYLGETEVTQELWKAVMGKNPSKFKLEGHPVEWIRWTDCIDFLEKLNQLTGQKFRLPMEAEWEWAARGGIYSKHYRYAGSDELEGIAWYRQNTGDLRKKHQPVAQLKPNELGLYDMTGNVSEWCMDYYVPYGEDPTKEPSNLAKRVFRIIRGGSYSHSPYYLRLSNRNFFVNWRHDDNLGLRLAL